jgi:2,5-diketo-D-gluconate reductase A
MAQIERLAEATGIWPAVNQIEWSPFGWNREMLAYCRDRGIVLQAYSPLTRAERLEDERLVQLATRYDRTPAQIVIRWQIQLGAVPLPKANQRDHLAENLGVFDFELTEDHMEAIGALNEHWSALGAGLQYE